MQAAFMVYKSLFPYNLLKPRRLHVLFHIDERFRDQDLIRPLLENAEKYNIKILFSSRRTSAMWRWAGADKLFDTIVIPRPHFSTAYLKSSSAYQSLTILPTEALGVQYLTESIAKRHFFDEQPLSLPSDSVASTSHVSRVKLFLCWGTATANLLKRLSPFKSIRFDVVGHPRYHRKVIADQSLARYTKTLRVGISTRFDSLNNYLARTDRYLVLRHLVEDKNIYDNNPNDPTPCALGTPERYYKDSLDLRNLFLVIKACSALSNVELDLRPHPREDLYAWKELVSKDKFPNLTLSLNLQSDSFYSWLCRQDVLITLPSTTVYDCLLCNVMPVMIDRFVRNREEYTPPLWDDYNKINAHIPRPSSMDELVQLLIQVRDSKTSFNWRNPHLQEVIESECPPGLSNDSIINILSSISDTYSQSSHSCYRRSLLPLLTATFYTLGSIINIAYKILRIDTSSRWYIPVCIRSK